MANGLYRLCRWLLVGGAAMRDADKTMIERVARVLEPQAWVALAIGDTLAYKNRRTSSLRKARAAIQAMREQPPSTYVMGRCIAISPVLIGGETLMLELWEAMIDAALSEGGVK